MPECVVEEVLMEARIRALREKTHLDIPIVILAIMFSLTLDKFEAKLFYILFAMLIFTKILTKALPWHLIARLTEENNFFIIVSSYIQISLLFAIFYSYSLNIIASWIFYVLYAFFLLLYAVLLSIRVLDFGNFNNDKTEIKHLLAVLLIFIISLFLIITIVLGHFSWGIDTMVFVNIFMLVFISVCLESYLARIIKCKE
jgi:hypothetical protein